MQPVDAVAGLRRVEDRRSPGGSRRSGTRSRGPPERMRRTRTRTRRSVSSGSVRARTNPPAPPSPAPSTSRSRDPVARQIARVVDPAEGVAGVMNGVARPASGTRSRARPQPPATADAPSALTSGRRAPQDRQPPTPAASASGGQACTKYCGSPRLPLMAIDRQAAATQDRAIRRARVARRRREQHRAPGAAEQPQRVDPGVLRPETSAGTDEHAPGRHRFPRSKAGCRRWSRGRDRQRSRSAETRRTGHDRHDRNPASVSARSRDRRRAPVTTATTTRPAP